MSRKHYMRGDLNGVDFKSFTEKHFGSQAGAAAHLGIASFAVHKWKIRARFPMREDAAVDSMPTVLKLAEKTEGYTALELLMINRPGFQKVVKDHMQEVERRRQEVKAGAEG